MFIFLQSSIKPLCLICTKTAEVMKSRNVKRRCNTKHRHFNNKTSTVKIFLWINKQVVCHIYDTAKDSYWGLSLSGLRAGQLAWWDQPASCELHIVNLCEQVTTTRLKRFQRVNSSLKFFQGFIIHLNFRYRTDTCYNTLPVNVWVSKFIQIQKTF